MKGLKYDYSRAMIKPYEIEYLAEQVKEAHKQLHERSGAGSEFMGWVDYPINYNKQEFAEIIKAAEAIRSSSEVLVVIGIGGSYLGARAAIEALNHFFYNMLPWSKRNGPEIYFLGNNISSSYMLNLLELIEDKSVSVCVVSKSGTTIETAIAFRYMKAFMDKKYGKGANDRIYAITDAKNGVLRKLADKQGYKSFAIAEDIGGRYSVLTPAGLLPIAVSGLDIVRIMEGAEAAYHEYKDNELANNECYKYAVVRNILCRRSKAIEVLVSYEPALQYFKEWWKQLYGESEGKDGKGIFPAAMLFSTDLHSMGQFVQDGTRNLYETVINIEKPKHEVMVIDDAENLDGLNFISGQSLDYVNKQAFKGTIVAHSSGGVPIGVLNVPELNEFYYGQMVYFFEKACGVSGYLLGVNPFDQPGIEEYKRNMFALLGKPGYEELKEKLEG